MGRLILDLLAAAKPDEGGLSKEMCGLIGIGIGALATIVVGLVPGWWNRGTEQRKIDLDQQKFLAEQRKEVKPDFLAAGEAMGTVLLGADADFEARSQEAIKARRALLSIAFTHQSLSAESTFRALLRDLSSPTEESLGRAAGVWPSLEQQILGRWPEPPS